MRSPTARANSKIGFRMLRSAPAMDLGVVADAAGMSVRELVIEVEQLRGRGRCDQFAAEAWTYPLITRAKRRRILTHRACTPFLSLRSTWEPALSPRDRIGGVAQWSHRNVDHPAAPRGAFAAAAAAPVPALYAAEQSHCPPAIATRLAAGRPQLTRRLAAVTTHPAALAALVTSTDETTRSAAAGRGDLPAALAATNQRP